MRKYERGQVFPVWTLAVLSALFGITTLWWWRNVTGNITETT